MFSLFDLLVLSRIPGIGPHRLLALVARFGDPARALGASERELAAVPGFGDRLAASVRRSCLDSRGEAGRFASRELDAVARSGAAVVSYWDPAYPVLLKRIYDPPPLLYVRGELRGDDRYAVALVGTRAPTRSGIAAAERLAAASASAGLCVVSGLARGIDTAAHGASLRAQGRTIAVVGSGLDVPYPPENAPLAAEIAASGAVVSEHPMGTRPAAANFPRRNRIIAGLSLGVVVIESALTGGAMITARLALEENREVFAVPGPAGAPMSAGCHALIREGRAKLAETLEDVLVELAAGLRAGIIRGSGEGPAEAEGSHAGGDLFP